MRKYWETPVESRVEAQGPARVPDSVQFGNVRISLATILAPMAGVTDTVFRRFIKSANAICISMTMSTPSRRSFLAAMLRCWPGPPKSLKNWALTSWI